MLHTVSEARSLVCDEVISLNSQNINIKKKVKILCLSQIDFFLIWSEHLFLPKELVYLNLVWNFQEFDS